MVDDVITTHGLTKRFGDVTAVESLDLAVREGEVYGCLGLNGAGKTTTVRMLTGALQPTEGAATVAGVDVTEDANRAASNLGVVFGENITPEPGFSPVRYLRYFGSIYGLDRDTIDRRARRLFDILALEGAERPIRELSGGNKRKVEIARAMLHGPRILFLDEPTRELDIPSKRELWRLFQYVADEGNVTIFLSSHDTREIATLCDRIGVLRSGRLAWEGTPSSLASGDQALVDALGDKLEGEPVRFEPG